MPAAGPPSSVVTMLSCRLAGHRYRFRAEGTVMSWECERCGDIGGVKEYPTAKDARRFAAAFDREDRSDLGRRAPLFGLLPLRIWRALRRRSGHR